MRSAGRKADVKYLIAEMSNLLMLDAVRQTRVPSQQPLLGRARYIRERPVGLSVYLDDRDVAIDTNHLERALRVIPIGKMNWLFVRQSLAPSTWVLRKV